MTEVIEVPDSYMIFFPEYATKNDEGYLITPVIMQNRFYLGPYPATLKEVGKFCKLDEMELTMLALTYGIK